MSKDKDRAERTISRERSGYKDPHYWELINCAEVIRACNEYFDRKGMPRNEYGGVTWFATTKKKR